MQDNRLMDPDKIRTLFSAAMSQMYRGEVPQYGTLIELVGDGNRKTLEEQPALHERLAASGELNRLDVERHGAIRLGTPAELRDIRRMFAVMGMYPVGYYDLSVAGIPVHSTAFRSIGERALHRNPFRVFTSLLRLELVKDPDLVRKAEQILRARDILTPAARDLIAKAEAEGGLAETDAKRFVEEALETFRWHKEATVDRETYRKLHEAHRLIADVVSFRGPHINHLTPRTLDIDWVQEQMPQRGIQPKAIVEGPPPRRAEILLRQTSFKALEEEILFPGSGPQPGTHTARFGEIEQRGIALTPAGRALYDRLLLEARSRVQVGPSGERAEEYRRELAEIFREFPDSYDELHQRQLAFFRYRRAPGTSPPSVGSNLQDLLLNGTLIADPQTYEDFLPVSAAGIFQSNLGSDEQVNYTQSSSRDAFEDALGTKVQDEMELYAETEATTLEAAIKTP